MSLCASVEHTLEPWFDSGSRVLILGTMPSVASRKQGCYYAHPQNRFWLTLSHVFGEEIPATLHDRRAFCERHGLALWDVLASCEIKGSDDASISHSVPNDLNVILQKADIRAVFTTGKKAKALYDALILPVSGIEAIGLPSTSPANRRWAPQEILDSAYAVLNDFEL